MGYYGDLATMEAKYAKDTSGLDTIGEQLDKALDLQMAQDILGLSGTNGKVDKGSLVLNVKDYGAKGDGVTDDTAAINAIFAAIPATQIDGSSAGVRVYFPPGIYLCNTVTSLATPASTAVLYLQSKSGVTIEGSGSGTIIRTTTAVADNLFFVQNCNFFKLDNLRIEAIGTTARIQRGIHVTCTAGGHTPSGMMSRLFVRCLANYRRVFDFACTSGSPTIWSGQAAFVAGDVGGSVMLNLNTGPFTSDIAAVTAVSGTLASSITASQTTITLNSPLTGAPSAGFTIQVESERMFVSAGGNTTSLTVVRGRGNTTLFPAAIHASGVAVTTSNATLADNVTATDAASITPGRVVAGGSSILYDGYAFGADNPGAGNMDLTGMVWRECFASRCHRTGFWVGNGTAANTLDNRIIAMNANECGIGVFNYGSQASVYGGLLSTNVVDFKAYNLASSSLVIQDCRSEGPALFYELTGGAPDGTSVQLSSIELVTFNSEDGVAIRHLASLPLTLNTVSLRSANTSFATVFVSASGTTNNPCNLTAINVSSNGLNSNLFLSGMPTCVRTIISSPRSIAINGFTRNTVVGMLLDNKLQINGGLVRGRTAVANTAYTVLASDGLVAYTSLSAARVVTLPAQGSTVPAGQEFIIKDESGSCSGTNTITITPPAGTIDGAANVVLNTAYAKVTLYTNGTNWFTR